MLLEDQTTDFHLNEYLIFLPILSNTAGVSFRSHVLIGQKPHTSQVRLARLIVRLEERLAEQLCRTAAIMQVSTLYLCAWGHCVGVHQPLAH